MIKCPNLTLNDIVDIECQQGICSPIFNFQGFSGLLTHPSISLVKNQDQHRQSMAIYLTSYIDRILIYYPFLTVLQFHKNLYF